MGLGGVCVRVCEHVIFGTGAANALGWASSEVGSGTPWNP